MLIPDLMNQEKIEEVKEKHGEEKVEKFIEENEELILDIVIATIYSIGLNMRETLSDVVDGLETEIEEIEDYFEEEEGEE